MNWASFTIQIAICYHGIYGLVGARFCVGKTLLGTPEVFTEPVLHGDALEIGTLAT